MQSGNLEDDPLFKCGHITMAARKLGFKIIEKEDGGKYSCVWVDLMNRAFLPESRKCDNRTDALIAACEQMQDFISIPKSDK